LNYFPGRKLKGLVVNYVRNNHLGLTGGSVLSARLAGSGGGMVSRANAYINAKHRVRTVILFREAEKMNGMVVGCANRTEWLTGTFVRFGVDHSADLMPLLHIYRSQLEEIAKFADLPKEILDKESDTDILPGVEDKGKLLGSYTNTDLILWGLENDIPVSSLVEKFGKDKVQAITTLFEGSIHYRETPYSLL
jgi:NAD+ synthase